MILFFGVRPGRTRTIPLEGISCPYCHTKGKLTVNSTPSFVHLFWIPVYRLGTNLVAECNHCKRGFFKEEFSPEMKQLVSEKLRK